MKDFILFLGSVAGAYVVFASFNRENGDILIKTPSASPLKKLSYWLSLAVAIGSSWYWYAMNKP